MDLLEKLGINPILLITQIINFLILLFILKRFLYKPILGMLEKRREKIAESLKKAEEIDKKFKETEKFREEELHRVSQRSQELLAQAKDRTEKMHQEMIKKSEDEASKILEKTRKEIQNEKEKILLEAKKEVASLTISAVEKVLENRLDQKSQQKIAEGAMEEMRKVYKS